MCLLPLSPILIYPGLTFWFTVFLLADPPQVPTQLEDIRALLSATGLNLPSVLTSPMGTQLVLDPGNSALLGESNPLKHWAIIQGWTGFMDGWLLAGGREATVGGSQQEIAKLPTESRLTSGNLAAFPCEVRADLSWLYGLSWFHVVPFWVLLGWYHGPDLLTQGELWERCTSKIQSCLFLLEPLLRNPHVFLPPQYICSHSQGKAAMLPHFKSYQFCSGQPSLSRAWSQPSRLLKAKPP